ncbi:MAG: VOC family protein [Cyanobacteria bacterium P01_H01_bin.58]
MAITYHLDHIVLTVQDIEQTCQFYQQVLNIPSTTFGQGRRALQLGTQKINLHSATQPLSPHAQTPLPGSADLCLITEIPLATLTAHIQQCGIAIEMGPVERTGARRKLQSIYIRDPDGNLIELANEQSKT